MNSCKEPLMGFIDYYSYYLKSFQSITKSDRDQLVRQIYFNIIPLLEKELRHLDLDKGHKESNRRYDACENTIIALNGIKEQLSYKQITDEKTYQVDRGAILEYFNARLEYLETIPLNILSEDDFEKFLAEVQAKDELSEYFSEFFEKIEEMRQRKREFALYEGHSVVEASQEAIRENSLGGAPEAIPMNQEAALAVSMLQEAPREILLDEPPAPALVFDSTDLPKPKDVLEGRIAFDNYTRLITAHFFNVRDRLKVHPTSYIEFVGEIGELEGYIFKLDNLKPENKEEFRLLNENLKKMRDVLKPCLKILEKDKSIHPESHHRFTINDNGQVVFIGNKKSLADRVKEFFSRITFS